MNAKATLTRIVGSVETENTQTISSTENFWNGREHVEGTLQLVAVIAVYRLPTGEFREKRVLEANFPCPPGAE